nr:MAG TPA: hypothetical protein [Bacteriophage sp.]
MKKKRNSPRSFNWRVSRVIIVSSTFLSNTIILKLHWELKTMLIVIDIKHFLDMTPTMDRFYRLRILAHWLDRTYNTIPPDYLIIDNDHWETEKIWQVARVLEKEYGGVPLKLPVNLLHIESLDIQRNALMVWVDDEEFRQRNPDLWQCKNISSKSPRRLRSSPMAIRVSGGIRL